jgi:hypothetical protein
MIQIYLYYFLAGLCFVGTVYFGNKAWDAQKDVVLNKSAVVNAAKSSTQFEEQVKSNKVRISKIKIERIIEDLSSTLAEIRKKYFQDSDRVVVDFNSRNILTSGIFVQAQMDLAINTKERIEKLIIKTHRDIQDITWEVFNAIDFEKIPEFSEEQKALFEIEKNKIPGMYKQFEGVVKSWEMRAVRTSQLTKDFKL